MAETDQIEWYAKIKKGVSYFLNGKKSIPITREDLVQEVYLLSCQRECQNSTIDQLIIDVLRSKFGRKGEDGYEEKQQFHRPKQIEDFEYTLPTRDIGLINKIALNQVYDKLNSDRKRIIMKMIHEGYDQEEIAKETEVSSTMVSFETDDLKEAIQEAPETIVPEGSVSVSEAAKILSISYPILCIRCRQGEVPYVETKNKKNVKMRMISPETMAALKICVETHLENWASNLPFSKGEARVLRKRGPKSTRQYAPRTWISQERERVKTESVSSNISASVILMKAKKFHDDGRYEVACEFYKLFHDCQTK